MYCSKLHTEDEENGMNEKSRSTLAAKAVEGCEGGEARAAQAEGNSASEESEGGLRPDRKQSESAGERRHPRDEREAYDLRRYLACPEGASGDGSDRRCQRVYGRNSRYRLPNGSDRPQI